MKKLLHKRVAGLLMSFFLLASAGMDWAPAAHASSDTCRSGSGPYQQICLNIQGSGLYVKSIGTGIVDVASWCDHVTLKAYEPGGTTTDYFYGYNCGTGPGYTWTFNAYPFPSNTKVCAYWDHQPGGPCLYVHS